MFHTCGTRETPSSLLHHFVRSIETPATSNKKMIQNFSDTVRLYAKLPYNERTFSLIYFGRTSFRQWRVSSAECGKKPPTFVRKKMLVFICMYFGFFFSCNQTPVEDKFSLENTRRSHTLCAAFFVRSRLVVHLDRFG